MKVAPHVGAWIETDENRVGNGEFNVAPHVGAWIETHHRRDLYSVHLSHLM